MIKYRVIFKIGYCAAWFEFNTAAEACDFATKACTSMVDNKDDKCTICIEVIDTSKEEKED